MTIRLKLMIAAVAVILVVNSLLSFATMQYIGHAWLGEVQIRVTRNLNVARAAYDNHISLIASFLVAASLDQTIAEAAAGDDRDTLETVLDRIYRKGGMDFVSILDGRGKVILRARNPDRRGDDLAENPLIAKALRSKTTETGTIILSREMLEAEGKELVERAEFELIPTPAARPTAEKSRSEGMVVAAAVPILDSRGQVAAILYGGDLLDRRYEIVDSIKRQVYPQGVYDGKEIGTVTIFRDDLRISTNVTMEDGSRAVGTRVSAAVADAVLDEGRTWEAPALVVNDWYFTCYGPIRDPADKIIGILYVGLLRSPFAHRRNVIVGVFLAIVTAATAASFVLLLFITELVLGPIRRITAMSRKVVEGDLTARVGIRPPGEMGVLCRAIDGMADAVAEREEQLKLVTHQQMGRSEQLASVGRLAAGVAHEINNPLTAVLTFACMLRDKENLDDQDREDLGVIIQETTRVAQIVRGLLDFARERPFQKLPLDINEAVRQVIRLLGNQQAFRQITIVEDLGRDLPRVEGDANQIQQVMLNLLLNACEAMPGGGNLLVRSTADAGNVLVAITDTGCGIKKEHLDQIFEPFFSTKPIGKGTGLGLSVSYGIVRQHGGDLDVESEEGKGSTFTVTLPILETAQR